MGKVKRSQVKTKRVLRIIGEINFDALQTFAEELAALEAKSDSPIIIELCSEGGDAYAGIAFYTLITQTKSPTIVKAFGCVMSAATIILAAGGTRIMHKDCWFMVHDECQKIKADNGRIARSESNHQDNFEDHWAEMLSRHSHAGVEFWRECSLDTAYLTAIQCKGTGLVHETY